MSLVPLGVGFSCATCWFMKLKLSVLSGTLSGASGLASTNLNGAGFGAGFWVSNSSGGISILNVCGSSLLGKTVGPTVRKYGAATNSSRCKTSVPITPICTDLVSGLLDRRGKPRRGAAGGGLKVALIDAWRGSGLRSLNAADRIWSKFVSSFLVVTRRCSTATRGNPRQSTRNDPEFHSRRLYRAYSLLPNTPRSSLRQTS